MIQTQKYINKPSLTNLTMIATLKVSSKGQVVIPEEIREELKIKEGTKLILIEKDGIITLEKEENFLKKLNLDSKEKIGWLALAEKSMDKIWNNSKDEEIWKKYL